MHFPLPAAAEGKCLQVSVLKPLRPAYAALEGIDPESLS